jgi:hypothetical protein
VFASQFLPHILRAICGALVVLLSDNAKGSAGCLKPGLNGVQMNRIACEDDE